jgi:hypothetical protein
VRSAKEGRPEPIVAKISQETLQASWDYASKRAIFYDVDLIWPGLAISKRGQEA